MDANGTRFKLLLGAADWGACTEGSWGPPVDDVLSVGAEPRTLADSWNSVARREAGTSWDRERHELTLARTAWRFPTPAGEPAIAPEARRGAAMDRYGSWYWIDPRSTGVLVTSAGSGATTRFWPTAQGRPRAGAGFGPARPEPRVRPRRLRGLAVTEDHYLIVGTLDPGGLLVFDLRAGGPPWHVAWPEATTFSPLDIAARPDGGVFVLDARPGAGVARRVWRLDRQFMVEPLNPSEPAPAPLGGTFGPADGDAAPVPPSPRLDGRIRESDAAQLGCDVVAIAVAGADRLVFLDRRQGAPRSRIRVFDADLHERPGSPHSVVGLDRRFTVHAMAVVGDLSPAGDADPQTVPRVDVYLVDSYGDQALRFSLEDRPGRLRLDDDFHPMRLFGGRGLVATPFGVWYDSADRWVPLGTLRRPEYAELATFLTPVLDGGEAGCVWHRLTLDACIPAETSVRVWTATSDTETGLEDATWRPEPVPYRRGDGSELPFPWTPQAAPYGTFELLFQAAEGRYLRVALVLEGNRRESPRLRALRAWYPRFSYLEHYLPHAYREDGASARFLDAFLANIEGLYTTIEDRVAMAQVMFDARTAPREALDWLASWIGAAMDPIWDEDRRRLFLRHAATIYRLRGTELGMRIVLGLALLRCPDESLFEAGAREPGGIRIIERFRTVLAPPSLAGDASRPVTPHEVAEGGQWVPGQGGAQLHERWAAFVGAAAAADPSLAGAAGPYPLSPPRGPVAGAWKTFSSAVLGFEPAATQDDTKRWQRFLQRRHRTVGALNAAHRRLGASAVTSFAQVSLPDALPADGAPLVDWWTFQARVLPSVRAAHSFSVLLPVSAGRADRAAIDRPADVRERRAIQDGVERLVALEKPAHTTFDVRWYWLAFRVGEARLGLDTRLDLGSRSPDLRPPAVLGTLQLGEGVLTSALADVPERTGAFSGSVDPTTRRVLRRNDG